MNSSISKELVLKDDDRVIEYKEKSIIKEPEKNKRKINSTTHKEINKVALYKKLLERDEFKRPESKEIVLDEDEYLNYLGQLIQKQYYPDLYKVSHHKVKYEILIKRINKQLEQAVSLTGNRTNSEIDNMEKINIDYLIEKNKGENINIDIDNLNVDSFCMKYSSDELESLKDIFNKDKMKRLQKYFWMYESEYRANEKLKALKEYESEYLALPFHEMKHFCNPNIITAESDAKNSLFFNPDYSNTNNRKEVKKMMSLPREETEINNFSSHLIQSEEKQVMSENTRLPDEFLNSLNEKQSSKINKKLYEAYENSDVVKLLKELRELDEKNEKDKIEIYSTPMVNGYKLIKDPKPNPGQIDSKVPIFTWGEIASTPNIISQRSYSGFSVPETPVREDIAHSLASKGQWKKMQAETKNTKVGSNAKFYELTPSAMKLLNSVKRKSSNIFDNPNSINDKTPSIHYKSTDLLNKSSFSIRSVKKK